MDYDKTKIDEVVLALLYLNMFKEEYGWRAWKGFDWDAMDRLHEQGYISNPKSKAKSVEMTDAGRARGEELFAQYFGKKQGG